MEANSNCGWGVGGNGTRREWSVVEAGGCGRKIKGGQNEKRLGETRRSGRLGMVCLVGEGVGRKGIAT